VTACCRLSTLIMHKFIIFQDFPRLSSNGGRVAQLSQEQRFRGMGRGSTPLLRVFRPLIQILVTNAVDRKDCYVGRVECTRLLV
jgi:hypothetical protein